MTKTADWQEWAEREAKRTARTAEELRGALDIIMSAFPWVESPDPIAFMTAQAALRYLAATIEKQRAEQDLAGAQGART